MTEKRLTLREISFFFFPLMLNVQLMSISHTIINATLARLPDPVTALASFSVAMVIHLFVGSPSYQNQAVAIAMVRDRRSLIGTGLYVLVIAVYVAVLLALIAFTPVGDFFLLRFLGVEAKIAVGVKAVIAMLLPLPFLTAFRGLFQGLIIQARRTGLVSFATGVRIAALFGFLALGSDVFNGPRLAAFGLLCCIGVETALVGFFAWRHRLEPQLEPGPGFREIVRFALPLAFSSAMQQTIPLLINAIISRFPDGSLALASFGVIRGFLFMAAGPLRNLQQAYLTLVRTFDDYRVLVKFHRRVSGALAALLILVAYPLNQPVLGAIMGLDEQMRRYIALPLACCALFPVFHSAVSLLRGIFTQAQRTGMLGRATLYRFIYLLLCWGLILLLPFPMPIPGIAVAIFLLISSEGYEACYMRLQHERMNAS